MDFPEELKLTITDRINISNGLWWFNQGYGAAKDYSYFTRYGERITDRQACIALDSLTGFAMTARNYLSLLSFDSGGNCMETTDRR